VIFFDQSGRSDDIGVFYRVGNLLQSDISRGKFFGVYFDVIFAHFPACHGNIRNT